MIRGLVAAVGNKVQQWRSRRINEEKVLEQAEEKHRQLAARLEAMKMFDSTMHRTRPVQRPKPKAEPPTT